ncbi:MAG: ABC transporter substrate-binding protein [Methanomassiliicoccus sp.]|nr:ABC transporter substrate-binding protein [Methanomassiliicoccus sp.]
MDSGKRKIIAIALVAVLAIAAVAAAIAFSGNNSTAKTSSVIDASSTTVTMEKVPERIVSGSPDISEIVAALDMAGSLVAVTDYCDYPAEVAALRDNGSTIGGFYTPNFEKIVSYNPDLIILSQGVQAQIDLASQLRQSGYTVMLIHESSDLATVYQNIEMIGNVTAKQSEATKLVDDMKAQVANIAGAMSGDSKPNILFVTYADEGFTNVWPAGGSTAIGEIINLAGGNNMFADMDGYKMASEEVLKQKASTADVIVMTIMYSQETPENKSAWFNSDPIWKESPAVKNNKVYYLTGQAESIFNRQSVRTVDAVQLLAEILHPDAFASKVPYNATGINIVGDDYSNYLPSGTASQSATVEMAAAVARD